MKLLKMKLYTASMTIEAAVREKGNMSEEVKPKLKRILGTCDMHNLEVVVCYI